MLGSMAWDDIGWHIQEACDEDKVFTYKDIPENTLIDKKRME